MILNILLNALHAVDSVYGSRCMRFETELLSVFPQMPRLNLYVFAHGEIFYHQRAVKKFLSIFKYEIALFLSQIRVKTLADSSVSHQEVTYAVLISFYFISLLSFLNSSIVKPFFLITDIKQNSRVYTKSFSSVLHSKEKSILSPNIRRGNSTRQHCSGICWSL